MQYNGLGKIQLDIDAIVLDISLDKDKIGRILNTSLDASKYLGSPPDGEIIGKNVNDLLPPALVEEHQDLMTNVSQYPSFSHSDRRLFYVDFNGVLTDSMALAKISPHCVKGISSVVLLNPCLHENTALLLVNENKEIMARNPKKLGRSIKSSMIQEVSHVSAISEELSEAI